MPDFSLMVSKIIPNSEPYVYKNTKRRLSLYLCHDNQGSLNMILKELFEGHIYDFKKIPRLQ